MPEFNVLADVSKCVSEQRAAEKSFRVMNARRFIRSPRQRGRNCGGTSTPSAFAVSRRARRARAARLPKLLCTSGSAPRRGIVRTTRAVVQFRKPESKSLDRLNIGGTISKIHLGIQWN